jgi:hypothetical protein
MLKAEMYCPENALSWDSRPIGGEENRHGLRLVATAPDDENGTVCTQPPRRIANDQRRAREHLSQDEVKAIIKAARAQSRYPGRPRIPMRIGRAF